MTMFFSFLDAEVLLQSLILCLALTVIYVRAYFSSAGGSSYII